jgi:hypothetical protein
MIHITIDTSGPEFAGHAKWPELSRVLRDLADKFEYYTQDRYRTHMVLMDAFGQHTGLVVEVGGVEPADVIGNCPPC